jgi:hypothetical protein
LDVLGIRVILNGILFFGFLTGAISLFLQKKNGITKAMALFTLFAAFHVGMLIIYGLIDAIKPENFETVRLTRIMWNWISFGWIVSGLYLTYALIKGKNDD